MTDDEIVKRILDGETDLYQLIIRRYNRRLYRVTWAIVHDEHEAEDVVQETYVRAYEHLVQFGRGQKFNNCYIPSGKSLVVARYEFSG